MLTSIDRLIRRLGGLVAPGHPPAVRDLLGEPHEQVGAHSGWLLLCLLQTHLRLARFSELLQVQLPAQGKSLSETVTRFGSTGYFPDEPNLKFATNEFGIEIADRSTGHEYFFYPYAPTQISLAALESTLQRMTLSTFPEQRLRELHRTPSTLYVSAAELVRSEWGSLVETGPDDTSVTLTQAAQPLLGLWPSIERRLADDYFTARLAIVAEDWEYLLREKMMPEHAATFEKRAETALQRRRQFIVQLASDEQWLGSAMNALADIDAPELPETIERALSVSPRWSHGFVRPQICALRLIAERKLDALYPRVLELMRSTRPKSQFGVYGPWLASIETLLEVGYQVSEALAELERACAGWMSAAELSLHHAPQLSRELFRRALTNSTHGLQEITAGLLAILDEPWTHDVLLDVLAGTDDIRLEQLCYMTLLESCNHDVHAKAESALNQRFNDTPRSSVYKQLNTDLFRHTISHSCEEIFPLRGRVK